MYALSRARSSASRHWHRARKTSDSRRSASARMAGLRDAAATRYRSRARSYSARRSNNTPWARISAPAWICLGIPLALPARHKPPKRLPNVAAFPNLRRLHEPLKRLDGGSGGGSGRCVRVHGVWRGVAGGGSGGAGADEGVVALRADGAALPGHGRELGTGGDPAARRDRVAARPQRLLPAGCGVGTGAGEADGASVAVCGGGHRGERAGTLPVGPAGARDVELRAVRARGASRRWTARGVACGRDQPPAVGEDGQLERSDEPLRQLRDEPLLPVRDRQLKEPEWCVSAPGGRWSPGALRMGQQGVVPAGHTPATPAPQITLWSCTWNRTGSWSSRIQPARSLKSTASHTGEKRIARSVPFSTLSARPRSRTTSRAHS